MSSISTIVADPVVPLIADTFNTTIENGIENAITQIPRVVGGLAVLLAGLILGGQLEPIVVRLTRRMGIDRQFDDTRLAGLFGNEPGSLSRGIGALAKYYVLLFAALIAVDVTEFQELTPWVEALVLWAPKALAGVAIILIGLVVADYAVQRTRSAEVVEASEFGLWIPALVRAFLYVIVFVIGLDMIGINLEIVYMIVDGITSAIGLGITAALALGLGVAAGLLAKDYVDRELDERAEASED